MRLAVFYSIKVKKTSHPFDFKKLCDKINLKEIMVALSKVYLVGDEKHVP